MVINEGLGIGINLFQDVISGTTFLGSSLIFQFAIVLATLLFITRKYNEWGELLFPVLLGWRITGVNISGLILGVSGVIFVLSVMSIKSMGGIIGTIKNITVPTERLKAKKEVIDERTGRLDIREEMAKLKIKSKNEKRRFDEAKNIDRVAQINFEKYGTSDIDTVKKRIEIENLQKNREIIKQDVGALQNPILSKQGQAKNDLSLFAQKVKDDLTPEEREILQMPTRRKKSKKLKDKNRIWE